MDFLLHRYGSLDSVYNMNLEDFLDLITVAREKELDDKIWQRWLLDSLGMNENNFINFINYKKMILDKHTITKRTDKEIIEDAKNILGIKREEG